MTFPRSIGSRSALIAGGVVFLVLLGLWFFLAPSVDAPESPTSQEPNTASQTEQDTGSASDAPVEKDSLPVEQPFVLPEGATPIDDYTYIFNNHIFFKSITGGQPLGIQTADADTFERLSEFQLYTQGNVLQECGAHPAFAYYGDKRQVYMYQVWRTPTFRTGRVVGLVGTKKSDFEVTGPYTVETSTHVFKIDYTANTASSTCSLIVSRTERS